MAKRKIRRMRVDYAKGTTPADYRCEKCEATGVKLWRQYQTFADYTDLLCANCAAKDQEKNIGDIDQEGKYTTSDGFRTDQIGWYIPAVPTEDGASFWGYTSIPDAGCVWWDQLPTLPPVESA